MPSEKILENKKAIVEQLKERFAGAQAGVIADYRGLTVQQDTELRAKLREAGVNYSIVKNNFIRFAVKDTDLAELEPVLHGPTAIATSENDPIAPARVLVDFAKENEVFEIKSGFIDGKVISVDEIKMYASIPSKEVLISKMLGSLQSPIGALARTLQAIVDNEATPGKAEEAPAEEAKAEEAPAEEAKAEEAPAEEAKAEEAPAEEAKAEEAPAEEAKAEDAPAEEAKAEEAPAEEAKAEDAPAE